MKTRILNLAVALLLVIIIGAKAQTEPEIIWHMPDVEASSLILSPDEQFVYANRTDVQLGNVFTQMRVDDGTIVRKDVSTIGHIGGFSVDGRYVFAINLRISNKIYKADAETFEKVDSLQVPEVIADHFSSYAMSYDRKYLYLGTANGYTQGEPSKNFYVVDTETMEVLHSESYMKTEKSAPQLKYGEVVGIYPSPNNDYVAIYVKVSTYNDIKAWLPVIDIRDNFKTVNSDLEYTSRIGKAEFSLDGKKLFFVEKTYPSDIFHIYSTMNFTSVEKLLYPKNLNDTGGLGTIVASKINEFSIFIGSAIRKEEQTLNSTKIANLNLQSLNEECYLESSPDDEFRFGIGSYLLLNNDKQIIAPTTIKSIVKFKNCTTSTGVNNNKQEAKILQVIDNKLTILIDAKKGINLNYQISDIRGVTITHHSLVSNSNELIIDVHNLVPGTYFLTLQIGKETVNYKFIILR